MNGRIKSIFVMLFSVTFAATMLFTSFADSVWAETEGCDAPNKLEYLRDTESIDDGVKTIEDEADDEESGEPEEGTQVHADPATFEKNFELPPELKEQTIKECEEIVARVIKPEMSDLEKYYTLAVEANKIANYDWKFWDGKYNFEYYSHQWDSYGVMHEDSVCAGIAIYYTHLCHAADLPCWFARMNPKDLDHTISYIPDINGNSYYVDVTEDIFLMSEDSSPWHPIDTAFSHITKDCTDTSFDVVDKTGEIHTASDIKSWYDKPFSEWFKVYALHQDPGKKFATDYVEKGSGLSPGEEGYRHVSYHDYRSNFVETTGVWFLDDFYRNPSELEQKILNNEFDEQLLNVAGIKKNYDCASQEELENAVSDAISVKYFPTRGENNQVVAQSADLVKGTDYDVTVTSYDADARNAVITIQGKDSYSGSYQIPVKLNSCVVDKEPAVKKDLVYSGEPQELVEAGGAEGGEIQYGLGTKTEAPEEFSADIPTGTDAEKYYVWYKVVGEEGREGIDPQYIGAKVTIAPKQIQMNIDEKYTITVGDTIKLSPTIDMNLPATFNFYTSDDEDVISVTKDGDVTGLQEGNTSVYVECKMKLANSNYEEPESEYIIIRVLSKKLTDIDDTRVVLSKSSFTYNGKVQKPTIDKIKRLSLKEGQDYTATWSDASSKNAGTYTVTIEGTGDYFGTTDATYTINKAPNPMTLKAKTVNLKYKTLKKKAMSVKQTKAFTVKNAEGKPSFKLVSAKKGSKNFKSKFKINAKTGKITVKKGLKKGTYKVKVKVQAKGSANYKASSWKTVTFKVKVK